MGGQMTTSLYGLLLDRARAWKRLSRCARVRLRPHAVNPYHAFYRVTLGETRKLTLFFTHLNMSEQYGDDVDFCTLGMFIIGRFTLQFLEDSQK